jgi:hypothetical protein
MKAVVLISAQNAELFLERAVESALANSQCEACIWVDPTSNDETALVASELVHRDRVQEVHGLDDFVQHIGDRWWTWITAHDELAAQVGACLERTATACLVGLTRRQDLPSLPTRASTWWKGSAILSRPLLDALAVPDGFLCALPPASTTWSPMPLASSTVYSPRRPQPSPSARVEVLLAQLGAIDAATRPGPHGPLSDVLEAVTQGVLDELEARIVRLPAAHQLEAIRSGAATLNRSHQKGLGRVRSRLDSRRGRWSVFARGQALALREELRLRLPRRLRDVTGW